MKLTRRQALTTVSAMVLSAPFVSRARASGAVHVTNWADYIGETTLADFEAETGISVVYDPYSSTEEIEAKMMLGQTGYDVVLQSGLSLPRLIRAGVYQKIDRSKLSNWHNLDPDILKKIAYYDPGHEYGVPYMWGSVGLTYNMKMLRERLPDADPTSLDLLMKPEFASALADCGISLLDSPTDFGFIVLKYMGIDPADATPADYDKMAEMMARVRPYISAFDNSNYLNAIPNGELCMAGTWSGDYSVARSRAAEAGIDLELAYFVPKSGAPAWFDLWAVPSDAANVENAHIFMNYLLRPEVIADCTSFTGYANANAAATPLLDPEISGDPAVYPDAETMSRLFTTVPLSDEQERALNRSWQTVKAGG